MQRISFSACQIKVQKVNTGRGHKGHQHGVTGLLTGTGNHRCILHLTTAIAQYVMQLHYMMVDSEKSVVVIVIWCDTDMHT